MAAHKRRDAGHIEVFLALAVLLALGLPGVAQAQQATLDGTTLVGTFTATPYSCPTLNTSYQASGNVTPPESPYSPGTFTDSGLIQAGPPTSRASGSRTFRITTSTGTIITGTAGAFMVGTCTPTSINYGPDTAPGQYTATITTSDGRSFSDSGLAFSTFVGPASGGQTTLRFASRLTEAQPIAYVGIASVERLTVSRSVIRFRMVMPAKVTFTVQRRIQGRRAGRRCALKGQATGASCHRFRRVGSFRRTARRGSNRVALPRKLRKRLRSGVYRLVARASNGGLSGPAEHRIFRTRR